MWLHPCSSGSKAKQQKAAGAISSACSFFASKSSCAAWKSQNMRKTLFSKADCSSIMDGYSLNGTDAEKEKYITIKKLLKTISTALEWAPIECAFTDKKCLKLALQNCGIDSC